MAGGASTQIDVSVSRLIGGSVTVNIAATDGLSVASSVTLTDLNAIEVAVSADAGASGTATLTFTAEDYATARVTVEIEDAPTQPDPAIGLVVAPTVLGLVTGESTNLTITASPTTATITISVAAGGDNIINAAEVTRSYELNEAQDEVVVAVTGVRSGMTTLTITAEADGYTSATASVRVEVIESLRIAATPVRCGLSGRWCQHADQCECEPGGRGIGHG